MSIWELITLRLLIISSAFHMITPVSLNWYVCDYNITNWTAGAFGIFQCIISKWWSISSDQWKLQMSHQKIKKIYLQGKMQFLLQPN